MVRAARAGILGDRFWGMTMREVVFEIKEHAAREAEAFRQSRAIAWFSAYYQRVAKMPSLEGILRPAESLSPAEREARQIAKLQKLAMMTGGVVIEPKAAN